MAWPMMKTSPELDHWGGTLIGRFYINDKFLYINKKQQKQYKRIYIQNLFSYKKTPNYRVEILRRLEGFKDLPSDVLIKLSSLSKSSVKRLIYSWRAIETKFLLTRNDIYYSFSGRKLLLRLWRWCICQFVYNQNMVTITWKLVSMHLKHFFFNTPQKKRNLIPRGVPFVTFGGYLSGPWLVLFPWLERAYSTSMDPSIKLFYKDYEWEQFGYLIQTRDFPPPKVDSNRFDTEVVNLHEQMSFSKISEEKIKQKAGIINSATKSTLDQCGPFKVSELFPHISVNLSAELKYTRKDGGRAYKMVKCFIKEYVNKEQERSITGQFTVFGAPKLLIKGVPAYKTLCRNIPLALDKRHRFLENNFSIPQHIRKDYISNGIPLPKSIQELTEYIREEHVKLGTNVGMFFGLDSYFPSQVLQLAIERAVRKKYLPETCLTMTNNGKLYVNRSYYSNNMITIPSRACAISETGNKVRFVTMEDWCINIILQPFAHFISGIIKRHPGAKHAFNRSYKGWAFASALTSEKKDIYKYHGNYIHTYDLSGASNNLNRNFLAELMRNFIMHLYKNTDKDKSIDLITAKYFLMCLVLALAPRKVILDKHKNINCKYTGFISHNGVPMGNTLTKELLVLSSLVINNITYSIYRTSNKRFVPKLAVAGDDIILVAPLSYFRLLIKINKKYGNVINQEKTLSSTIGCYYCEELIRFDKNKYILGCGLNLHQVNASKRAHIDLIKTRLLQPYNVMSLMVGPNIKNPAIGKGQALSNLLNWKESTHDTVGDKSLALSLFYRNFKCFISKDIFSFMPAILGGHGIPIPFNVNKDKIIDIMYKKLTSNHRLILNSVIDKRVSPISVDKQDNGNKDKYIINVNPPTSFYSYLSLCSRGVSSRSLSLDHFIADKTDAFLRCATKLEPFKFNVAMDKVCQKAKLNNKLQIINNKFSLKRIRSNLNLIRISDLVSRIDKIETIYVLATMVFNNIPFMETYQPYYNKVNSPADVMDKFRNFNFSKTLSPFLEMDNNKWKDTYCRDGEISRESFKKAFLKAEKNDLVFECHTTFISRELVPNYLNSFKIPIPYEHSKLPFVHGNHNDEYCFVDKDTDLLVKYNTNEKMVAPVEIVNFYFD